MRDIYKPINTFINLFYLGVAEVIGIGGSINVAFGVTAHTNSEIITFMFRGV